MVFFKTGDQTTKLGSIHANIYDSIWGNILSGDLALGERLPSSSALAAEAGVSRNSVLAAYDQLIAEGYAAARKGSGTYVAPDLPEDMQIPASPRKAAGSA